LSRPGRKNDAGEIECEALIPPHPAPSVKLAAIIPNRRNFQCNLTEYAV